MLIRLLRRYLAPSKRLLGIVVALQLVATMAALTLPTLNARIIDNGVITGDIDYILRFGMIMLGISVLQVLCTIGAVRAGAMAAMMFGRDVRGALFHRVLGFSAREVNHFGAPSLITRNTNDAQQVQMLVMLSTTLMVTAPINMIGGVFMALREDVGLSGILLVSVPVLVLVIAVLVRFMSPLFRAMQKRIDALNRVLREQIQGIRVVRAFVREPYEAERFARANADLTDTATKVGRLMAMMFPLVMLIVNLSSVAVIWFGAGRIESGSLQVGQLTAFLAYLIQILMSVLMATFVLVMAPRAAVCAERIGEVLETPSSVADPVHPVTALDRAGHVRFAAVEFSYPGADEPVLKGVSFAVEPGKTTAIIGSTGSGKTTLISLIPRLFDATGGAVSVDGSPVGDIDQELLWSRIGLVPQKPFLFSGTIASNLRYGNPEATDSELWTALEVAQARDFVEDLEEGLEAPIAQGGTNVSGGQRQRLSIARALVKRPEIYIFDDSFSALDVATDARLRASLKPFTASSALIIVAQRVSTIIGADQIVVLEDGEIVGLGRHEELLETCPTYAEIVDSQLSTEAAA